MTINDEFFKKTQENLRRIKAQNNKKTLKNYNIDGKAEAEELPSTQPQVQQQPQQQVQQQDNVIVVDFQKKSKYNQEEANLEARYNKIAKSIQRINKLMQELSNQQDKK
jgi:hypothetical protein